VIVKSKEQEVAAVLRGLGFNPALEIAIAPHIDANFVQMRGGGLAPKAGVSESVTAMAMRLRDEMSQRAQTQAAQPQPVMSGRPYPVAFSADAMSPEEKLSWANRQTMPAWASMDGRPEWLR
jgi:hypothetical protein